MAKSRPQANKKRRKRRRRARGVGVLLRLLVVVVVAALLITAVTVFFRIRDITVTGDSRYDAEDIIAASGLAVGDNMFFFNKFAAIERIFADHPYLNEISIRRSLPDGIEIIVTECEPVAIVQGETGAFLIDLQGKLLEQITPGLDELYPIIHGVPLDGPQVGKTVIFLQQEQQNPFFLLLNSLYNNGILQDIGAIDLSKLHDVRFSYTDRFDVHLGTTEELDRKMRYMQLIVADKLSSEDRGIIDVSDTQTARFIPE